MKDWSYRGWTHTAAMGMQNRIPTLGGIHRMDMAYQLDRMRPQGKMVFKEKDMEPKFKVGDIVKTPTTAPAQPIFRLKRKDGASGGEGFHFVLVTEDEHEMQVREVDIDEAEVRDRVTTIQKSIWTRDYSIGDEIINFLQARGGNFINKVVDNG